MTSPPFLFSERLLFVPAVVAALGSFLAAVIALPFRAETRATTRDRDIANALTRAVTTHFSVRQLQHIQGSSSATFDKWKAAHPREKLSTEVIEQGAKLHWVGSKQAQRVLLLFHGGGYVLPLATGHIKLMSQFRDAVAQETGLTVAASLLEYTTSPQAPYPTQLRQAAAALAHLLASGIPPSSIILCGDSAGAHLVLCLVSHLLHPHPDLPMPPTLTRPLGGLLLISPRPSIATTAPSFAENSDKDILRAATFQRWIDTFMAGSVLATPGGPARDGPYTSPVDAPAAWWDGLATRVVKRVFMSAGQHECLRDDIVKVAGQWKELEGLEVKLVVEHKGVHDSPMLDCGAGRPKTDLLRAMENWLASVAS